MSYVYGVWCAAKFCYCCRRKNKDLSFFKFPRDPDRCRQWVMASGREDLLCYAPEKISKNYVLCSEHFTLDQFINPIKRRRLIWSAIPTIFEKTNLKTLLSKKTSSCQSSTDNLVSSLEHIKTHQLLSESRISESAILTNEENLPEYNLPIITSVCGMYDLDSKTTKKRKNSNLNLVPKRVKWDAEDAIQIKCHTGDSVTREKTLRRRRLRMILYKYRVSLQRARCQIELMQSSFKKLEKYNNPSILIRKCCEDLKEPARTFFVSQFEFVCSNGDKKSWTEREKQILLALYLCSKKTYSLCQQIFHLPCVGLLQQWISRVETQEGFSETVKSSLNIRSQNLSETHKLCLILFDEIPLTREPLDILLKFKVNNLEKLQNLANKKRLNVRVLVFMVKGLTQNWKQPLGYFFLFDKFTRFNKILLVKEAIDTVNDSGFIVTGVVSSQNNAKGSIPLMLGIGEDKPYFFHNTNKIFFFYDPNNLLKSFRNNFKKYCLLIGNKTAKWEHIVKLYKLDREQRTRLVPKLNFKHVYLPEIRTVKMNLVNEVFNYKLSAALSCLSLYRILPEEAKHTAEVLMNMRNWNNCFNASAYKTKKECNIFKSNSKCKHFLESFLIELGNWKFHSKYHLTTVSGLKLTIISILKLWDYLKEKFHLKFILTSSLTLNILEDLSTILRGTEVHGKLTPSEFELAFKEVLINSLLLPVGYCANSTSDYKNLLICFEDLIQKSNHKLKLSNLKKVTNLANEQWCSS